MQSYLQFRRLGQNVHKQLENAPEHGATTSMKETPGGSPTLAPKHASDGLAESDVSPLAQFIPGIDVQKQPDASSPNSHVFVVGWEGENDPLNPYNFSYTRRMVATLLVTALAFIVGAASAIESGVLPQITEAYGVSDVVGSLVTGKIVSVHSKCVSDLTFRPGVYLLGFAAGSLVSGPLSEILGRNAVYAGSLTLFMIFIMGSALAPNLGAQLAFRFLAGIFGCPPLTCAGGTIADLWNPLEKTITFPMYAILSFGGPVLAPVIASFIGQTGVLAWEWTAWIILIASGAIFVLVLLFQPETYSPLLLKWKGKHLRQKTGDTRFRSAMDMDKVSIFSRIGGALKRQFLITFHEPIILLISLYMTVLYIVLFTFFDGYTDIFTDVHGLSQGLTNIVWVAMYVGIALAGLLVLPIYRWTKTDFTAAAVASNGTDPALDRHALDSVHTQPEIRLWFAMFGAPMIPISLFWMGWTDFASVSIWSPIVASSLFGFGCICIFISSYMYIIDSYGIYAASALGFMTVSRYFAAGGMTVVGIPFYKNMGVHWTLTILGCISAIMVPVPYVFYCYGPVIRKWSRYAAADEVKGSV
ncbi:unnamed protein product [Penicillium salamii]|uniref:Major facilitator superfamily (MFS) profile domain-containing protein n=1 Tax=Penicillium salamii TaxID=1612424 RepID=A0A9W4N505_9EURO|nr:unnamed protein product [Penicillium salamii]CAG8237249.1 unnamed protein product [Penicillium salamii]CAG8251192.1 unnamed protein product [Penicillium salamii]CAG8265527.1 unnamed protein product [Penicillium salamii]CAG8351418.1 unnamed protein product [Penicillium salamii]